MSLPEDEWLLSHLEGCDSCAQRLEGLSEKDTLVELIRQARTQGDPPGAETIARLVEQLRKLKPKGEGAREARAPMIVTCPACGKKLRGKPNSAGRNAKCPK